MTSMRTACVAPILLVLASLPSVARGGKLRQCRETCGAAIADCVSRGGRPKVCRRAVLRQCRRSGGFCGSGFSSTTSTTLPMTYPSGNVAVVVKTVETLYEIASAVPAADAEFVRLKVELTNQSNASVTPSALTLFTGDLGYTAFYPYMPYPSPPADDACTMNVVVPSGQTLTCTTVFQVPEGSKTGHVELLAYVPYTGGNMRSEDFAIPSAPRPYATVTVLDASPAPDVCTARPGYEVILLRVRVASHNGATELTLGAPMSVVADAARYTPTYCNTVLDPCDSHIGVPTDGDASCSVFFEVPQATSAAELDLGDFRYPASTTFTAP